MRLPGDALRLYYAGWQRGVGVRYALFLGAAESDDDGASFRRVSEAPLLDRSDGELYTRSSALVIATDEGWRMWYAGGSEWVGAGADAKPRYALRHLRSADGVAWPRSGEICLEPAPGELGFSRPCVRVTANTIHMWYSLRTVLRGYDLGYATSVDGMAWQRMDQAAGLERGPHGSWDAEMIGLSSLLETGRMPSCSTTAMVTARRGLVSRLRRRFERAPHCRSLRRGRSRRMGRSRVDGPRTALLLSARIHGLSRCPVQRLLVRRGTGGQPIAAFPASRSTSRGGVSRRSHFRRTSIGSGLDHDTCVGRALRGCGSG